VAGGPEGLMVLELLFIFNPATVNPDSGCVAWPGGVDLCPDAMQQAMTGAESELLAGQCLVLPPDDARQRAQ